MPSGDRNGGTEGKYFKHRLVKQIEDFSMLDHEEITECKLLGRVHAEYEHAY